MAVDYSQGLIEAFIYFNTFNMGMGDSLYDTAHWLADEAGLDLETNYEYYDDLDDEDLMLEALEKIVVNKPELIPNTLLYVFTEDNLIEDVLDELESPYRKQMWENLDLVYETIGNFPGGDKVKEAMEKNIFDAI